MTKTPFFQLVHLRLCFTTTTATAAATTTTPSKLPSPSALKSKLIKTYCDQGLLSEARHLFDAIPQPDVVTWTAMISGYTSNARHHAAWISFLQMQSSVHVAPNAYTISNVLKACKGMGCRLCGTAVHALAVKRGVDGCVYVENALVDMYAACGESLDDAREIFEGMKEKSAVSWTTIIAGYTRRGEGRAGLRAFRRMLQDDIEMNPFSCSIAVRACTSVGSLLLGKQLHAMALISGFESNLPVANSLLDLYCRCDSSSEAKQYFKRMSNRDLITWNTIIAGFERISSHESLELFSQMVLHDLKPNCFTFTSIAASCANLAVLTCGQQAHGGIIRRGLNGNLALTNALIDMYAKCGCIVDSSKIFKEMNQRDLLSWTSMIIGYGNHGYGEEAIKLFNEMVMLHLQPDRVVFMGVLSACSHAGLVNEGLEYFNSMSRDYGVSPDQEIYGCVVDLLGRCGRVQDAYELIKRMPFEPDESVWGALLGACKVHRKMDLGRVAARSILDLKPKGAETYVILSNIYAADGKWDDFAKTRRKLRAMATKKEAGRSWIEIRNQVCSFVVGERINPHFELVYEELERLVKQMKDSGYVPDFDCSFHDLEVGSGENEVRDYEFDPPSTKMNLIDV